MKETQIGVRVTQEFKDELYKKCEERLITPSKLFEKLLKDWLAKQK